MQPDTRSRRADASVWIVEDHTDYAETVQDLVNDADGLSCPQRFSSGEAVLEHLTESFAPDVLLVDIGLPGIDGIEVVEKVSGFASKTRFVMLTINDDEERIFQAVSAGATGYLLKSDTQDEIIDAIRVVLDDGARMNSNIARKLLNIFTQRTAPRGDYGLTKRELEVLHLLVEGKTKDQAAAALIIEPCTVDTHTRNIYRKLQVHNRAAAVAKALTENLVSTNGGK